MRLIYISFAVCLLFIAGSSLSREAMNQWANDPARARVLPLTSQRFHDAGLPESIRHGYDFLDSVCRSMEVFQLDAMLGHAENYDALRPYLSTMYFLSDYDPVLYIQHLQYSPTTCAHAYFAPERIQHDVFSRLVSLRIPNARRIESLISSAGIYHIRVIRATYDTIKTYDDSGRAHALGVRMIVTAEIVDTLKGRHWLPGRTDPISGPAEGGEDRICFTFDPMTPCRQTAERSASLFEPSRFDEVQVDKSLPASYGDYHWSPGAEFIVFLQFGGYDNDGSYDYFAVHPQSQFDEQGGVYPVVDGSVRDQDNFWGFGTSVSLEYFQSGLRQMASDILHGSRDGMFGAIGQR